MSFLYIRAICNGSTKWPERGVTQGRHMVMQGPHDYVNVAHARLVTIELLQCNHCHLHDNAIICTTLPKL
jgi:hypothetical protein